MSITQDLLAMLPPPPKTANYESVVFDMTPSIANEILESESFSSLKQGPASMGYCCQPMGCHKFAPVISSHTFLKSNPDKGSDLRDKPWSSGSGRKTLVTPHQELWHGPKNPVTRSFITNKGQNYVTPKKLDNTAPTEKAGLRTASNIKLVYAVSATKLELSFHKFHQIFNRIAHDMFSYFFEGREALFVSHFTITYYTITYYIII
jgi:hypothetical protein